MTKSRSVGLVLGVLIGLALVACSAPAPAAVGGSGAPSSSGSAAQQGIENKVITIGLATVLSGPSASASQIAEGAKVYLDMANRNGGVNGYTFKYVERDTANQPAQGVAAAQQLLNEDKVFAILTAGSPVVQALVPIALSLKAPILLSADADLVRTVPNMYAVNPRYTLLPLFEAQFLIMNLGIKDIAYVYPDDASGRPGLKNLPNFVSANGGRRVASLPFAQDTTDWAPFATQLKESGAQGVVFFSLLLPGLQKAADAIGYHPKWVGNFGNLTPSYLKLAGPLAEGTYVDSMAEPVDGSTPTAQKFNAELKAAGKESIIGLFAESGWTTGAIVEEGVRRATANGAALTWDSFMAALNTFNHQQVGVYPSISYTPQDHTGATQSSIYQVQNGKFVQVLPMSDIPEAPGSS